MDFKLRLFGILLIFSDKFRLGLPIKYLADVERAEQCTDIIDDSLESKLSDLKFEKINRTTRALSFNITNKAPIDDDVGLQIDMEKWVDAGWTTVPFIPFQPNACNILSKMFRLIWRELMTHLGLENPTSCPIPAGQFRMDRYIFDATKLSNFAPFKGRFRYRVMLVRKSTQNIVSCLIFVVNMIEAV